jgi:putative Mn2+ efflux pump MntP
MVIESPAPSGCWSVQPGLGQECEVVLGISAPKSGFQGSGLAHRHGFRNFLLQTGVIPGCRSRPYHKDNAIGTERHAQCPSSSERQMSTSGDQNDAIFANWALAFLTTGLLLLVTGVVIFFNSGPPQTTAKTCLFLCSCVEGIASVVGVAGRRYARAKVAIIGGVILSPLSAWMLVVLVQLLRNPPGI